MRQKSETEGEKVQIPCYSNTQGQLNSIESVPCCWGEQGPQLQGEKSPIRQPLCGAAKSASAQTPSQGGTSQALCTCSNDSPPGADQLLGSLPSPHALLCRVSSWALCIVSIPREALIIFITLRPESSSFHRMPRGLAGRLTH